MPHLQSLRRHPVPSSSRRRKKLHTSRTPTPDAFRSGRHPLGIRGRIASEFACCSPWGLLLCACLFHHPLSCGPGERLCDDLHLGHSAGAGARRPVRARAIRAFRRRRFRHRAFLYAVWAAPLAGVAGFSMSQADWFMGALVRWLALSWWPLCCRRAVMPPMTADRRCRSSVRDRSWR